MAYIINKTNGEALLTLQDGTVDASTSVQLVGRNYVGYGEIQNENFLFLLENFANDAPPPRPLAGQTWFDTAGNVLNVYDGDRWTPMGTATISLETPEEPGEGQLWFKEPYNILYVYSGTEWVRIGPEALEGYGETRAEATLLEDDNGQQNPVLLLQANGIVCGVVTSRAFTISDNNPIEGLLDVVPGINVPVNQRIQGTLLGDAESAQKLSNIRTINGVGFNGTSNITVKASTTNPLVAGEYIVGTNFDGSAITEWTVNAATTAEPLTLVARDFNGDIEARYVKADKFIGQVAAPTGTSTFDVIQANQITGATISGIASSAARLSPGKNINGVKFDGTQDITVTASAQTLTGTYINSSVISSNLQTVGTLARLQVQDEGIKVGIASQFSLSVSGGKVNVDILNGPLLSYLNSSDALAAGGEQNPAIIPRNIVNIGTPNYKFDNMFANTFHGTATAAQFADLAEWYSADKEYTPGTVLVFGGEAEVTTTTKAADPRVAGVVTTEPGFVMNDKLEGVKACIALQGRVPVKVIGPVTKGEMLVTSETPGYAKVSNVPQVGTVIGKSLETNNTMGPIVVEVSVGKM